LLQWREGSVQVYAQIPRCLGCIMPVEFEGSRKLDHELLRVAIAEIEAGAFEHESFEPDNEL
jgi:hypothetical protein